MDRPAIRARHSAAIVAVLAVALALALPWGIGSKHAYGDEHLYLAYGDRMQQGDLPYRDFYVEYPPGALPVFVGPALIDGHQRTAFRLLMAALWAVAAGAAVATAALAGIRGLRLALVGSALVGFVVVFSPLLLNTYDAWPAALVALALLAHVSRRDGYAGGLLGLAVAAKLLPALLLPLVWRSAVRRGSAQRLLAALVAAGGAVTVPFLLLAPTGLGHSLETQLRRGLHVESVPATVFLVGHAFGAGVSIANQAPGSVNVLGSAAGAVAAVASALLVALVGLVVRARWRDDDVTGSVLAAAVAVAATLVLGKVLSPQYLTWAAPVVVATGSTPAIILVLAAAGLSITFPVGWLTPFDLVGDVWWAVMRNGMLVGLLLLLWLRLARELPDEKRIERNEGDVA